MQSNIAVGISIPKEVLKHIDAKRGDVPRSKYLLRILERTYSFGKEESSIESRTCDHANTIAHRS
jgi:hypothetical protein